MNLVTVLKVAEVSEEILFDKNGREYKRITLESGHYKNVADRDTSEVITVLTAARRRKVNSYKESYLTQAPDLLWNAKVGDYVMGSFESRSVPAYEIDGRTVTTYTDVVLGDNSLDNWDQTVAMQFKRAGHPIVGYPYPEETEKTAAPAITQKSNAATPLPVTQTSEELAF